MVICNQNDCKRTIAGTFLCKMCDWSENNKTYKLEEKSFWFHLNTGGNNLIEWLKIRRICGEKSADHFLQEICSHGGNNNTKNQSGVMKRMQKVNVCRRKCAFYELFACRKCFYEYFNRLEEESEPNIVTKRF